MPPLDPAGPLARLRAATAQAHHDLDSSLGVLDRPWGVDGHVRWLGATWGLLAPLEDALGAWAVREPGVLDVRARARAEMALADLRVLGVDEGSIAALPRCPDVPAIGDRASALGVAYVMDGSTLGGKLIAQTVIAAGVPEAATTSLTGAEGTGRRWRETMAAVEALDADEVPTAIAAATATFAAYRGWLAPLTADAP